jgi:hypothetical protein
MSILISHASHFVSTAIREGLGEDMRINRKSKILVLIWCGSIGSLETEVTDYN